MHEAPETIPAKMTLGELIRIFGDDETAQEEKQKVFDTWASTRQTELAQSNSAIPDVVLDTDLATLFIEIGVTEMAKHYCESAWTLLHKSLPQQSGTPVPPEHLAEFLRIVELRKKLGITSEPGELV